MGDKYQAHCTMYKTHAMATCHRGTGCPLDRDIDLNIEDSETTGIDNNNESTHGLDATVALGGPEAEGHSSDPTYSNQAKWMALMREINDLHQWVEAGEGQPVEFALHRMRTTKSLNSTSSTSSTYTNWTFWRSDTSVHEHHLYHTKANKRNQLSTTGHTCFQWVQLYKIGRMAHGYRDSSRSNKQKLS